MLPLPALFAQDDEQVIDEVVALVGRNIILVSDIENQYLNYRMQGGISGSSQEIHCKILEDLLYQKLMVVQAEYDSIEVTPDQAERIVYAFENGSIWLTLACAAASAAIDHIHDWVGGTPNGDWVSMAVRSDSSYGVPEGLISSFPVTCTGGVYSLVQGLDIDEFSRAKIDASVTELQEERDAVAGLGLI